MYSMLEQQIKIVCRVVMMATFYKSLQMVFWWDSMCLVIIQFCVTEQIPGMCSINLLLGHVSVEIFLLVNWQCKILLQSFRIKLNFLSIWLPFFAILVISKAKWRREYLSRLCYFSNKGPVVFYILLVILAHRMRCDQTRQFLFGFIQAK